MNRMIGSFVISFLLITYACKNSPQNIPGNILPDIPEGAQAISLLGDTLYPSTPYENVMEKYNAVLENYKSDTDNAENIIWYGRWSAYKGDYRAAIKIFAEGIKKFPNDARFYRHRGHRYISVREFDRAIQDFEKAVVLIEGKQDTIEPDGQPNAFNKPVSSLHTNIWYHLGLAYYLKHDLENALNAYEKGLAACQNDDMYVAFTHWYYMTLRLLGRDDDAEKALKNIKPEMEILENMAYHKLCLFYKGEMPEEELIGGDFSKIMNDATAYGIANWYFYNGEADKAKTMFEELLKTKIWASFGYIAAEADYARLCK